MEKRFVPLVVILWSVIISAVLAVVWPAIQGGINAFWPVDRRFSLYITDPGTFYLWYIRERLSLPFGAASYADDPDEL